MTGRQKAIAFFITLTVCLVLAAIALNIGWIVIHWRRVVPLVLGVIFFMLIIAGLIVYTVFLVREIRRNEQHDSFISAVTHELKTPIASLRLYLETLQSRETSEAQRKEFYNIMLADTDRLRYTVDQVLKAGIAGQKKRGTLPVSVDVAALCAEAVEIVRLRHHLTAGQIAFQMNGEANTIVLGDAEDLLTAITNLLDNAVKYSREHVQIKVEVATHGARKVAVRVHDSGIGLPRKQLKLIFDRFYRVQEQSMKVKGTGLGLFIVQSIAKKHGGRVFAESAGEGQGSIFTLELPRAES